MKPHWNVPIPTAAIALMVAACAIAPEKVEPAKVPAANYAAMDCGELRHALYGAEADVRSFSASVENFGLSDEEKQGIAYSAIAYPPLFMPLIPIFLSRAATRQSTATDSLAHAKGQVQTLTEVLRTRGCVPWAPGPGAMVATFDCVLWYPPFLWYPPWPSNESPPPPTQVRVAVHEYQLKYVDRSQPKKQFWSEVIAGERIAVSRTTSIDATGKFTILERNERAHTLEIRAADCSPATPEEIGRARAVIGDWLQSLTR